MSRCRSNILQDVDIATGGRRSQSKLGVLPLRRGRADGSIDAEGGGG
jgi:hypothetical protein